LRKTADNVEKIADAKSDDPRSVNIVVSVLDEKVVLSFSEAIKWISLDPISAIKVSEQVKTAALGLLRKKPSS
jgi:hypothetical protein